MEFTISQEKGRVPVTVLHMTGRIDGSNYESVFGKARELYDGGARDLLLDLSEVSFISSAGIVALHRISLLFRGEKVDEEESGWSAIHSVDRDQGDETQQHVKLFNPRPDVDYTLDLAGFKRYFDVFTDLPQAVAAF
jgi:anti-anti-sigma regulatory factor